MKRAHMQAVVALALASGLGWFLASGDTVPASLVQARRDAWTLPDLPRKPDLVAQGLAMVTSPIFGTEPQAAGAVAAVAPEDTRWRVAGIFRSGVERTVLVSFVAAGKEPLRLHVGQALPSGHRITRIDDSEVCVQIGKKTFRLGVEYRE